MSQIVIEENSSDDYEIPEDSRDNSLTNALRIKLEKLAASDSKVSLEKSDIDRRLVNLAQV